MHPSLIEKARKADIVSVLEQLDIPYRRESDHVNILCINHEEDTPSLSIYDDHVHCWGCGWHVDNIDFVRKVFDCTFSEAVMILNNIQ